MESTRTGHKFSPLPNIPSPMNYHCMAALSNGDVFVAAGRTFGSVYGGDAFLLERKTGEWRVLCDVPTRDQSHLHVCTVHNRLLRDVRYLMSRWLSQ